MTNELKPCPFCGGEAEYGLTMAGEEVYCTNCGAAMPRTTTKDAAIEAWNTRAERTCHNTEYLDGCFACSACGEELEDPRQEPGFVKWCPFCGAKVVD